MSCRRSTVSTEPAAICLRARVWPWVAACQAREDAAVALHSPFQSTHNSPLAIRMAFGYPWAVGPLRARSGPSIGFAESNRADTRPNDARSLAAGTPFSLSLPLAALRPRDGTANELPEVCGPLDAARRRRGPGSACPAVARTGDTHQACCLAILMILG